jgi:hypothetical protein
MINISNLKKVLSALAILAFIPILLTLLFLLYALIFIFYDILITSNPNVGPNLYFILRPITLFVILTVLSWFILLETSHVV